jgi:hypothetical protein
MIPRLKRFSRLVAVQTECREITELFVFASISGKVITYLTGPMVATVTAVNTWQGMGMDAWCSIWPQPRRDLRSHSDQSGTLTGTLYVASRFSV